MKTSRRVVFVFCGLATLSLAACGEGYEMVKVYDQIPYSMERTAGPGVAYVLAHMMPEKTLSLPKENVKPLVSESKVIDAEPMFDKKMNKK